MIRIQRSFGLFIAFVLAMLVAPGAIAQKVFFAEFPEVVASGVSTIQVKFFNATPPPGVSTINSIRITPPALVQITAINQGTMSPAAPAVGQAVIVTNITGIKRGESRTFLVTVNNTATTCQQGTWDADANTGNAYPQGTEFEEIAGSMKETSGLGCDGILKCPSLPTTAPGIYNFTQTDSSNTTTGLRWENKDASACVPVVFNLTFSNAGKTLLVEWDESTQPFATLETTTTWPLELIDPVTSLPHRTKVAWELSPLKEIPAPACLSSNPPAPYGTLTAPITGLPTSFQITAASLPAKPFAIVVPSNQAGTDPERILVKDLTGPVAGVFTVTDFDRGSGDTTISDHDAGAAVVSTPLPVIASNAQIFDTTLATPALVAHPYAGRQAQACLIDEQFETQPFGTAGCPSQAAGAEPLSCVLVKSTLFLIGDPVITRSY